MWSPAWQKAGAPMKSVRPRFVSTFPAGHRFAGGVYASAGRNITETARRRWTFSDVALGLPAGFWKFSDLYAKLPDKFGGADLDYAAAV